MKKALSITLDEEVIQEIDENKGGLSRSTYLNEILRGYFAGLEVSKIPQRDEDKIIEKIEELQKRLKERTGDSNKEDRS